MAENHNTYKAKDILFIDEKRYFSLVKKWTKKIAQRRNKILAQERL